MLVHRSAVQVSIPGVRTGSPRRSRRLAASLACVLAATIVVGLGATTAAAGQFGRSPLAALDLGICPGGAQDAGWALSTTTFDPAFYRHAFVGNGYLGQRLPPTGMGYMATGEKTGWPLFTPRYDGAFVAGLYAQDPGLAGGGRPSPRSRPGRRWRSVPAPRRTRPRPRCAHLQLPAGALAALWAAQHRADLDHQRWQVDRSRL